MHIVINPYMPRILYKGWYKILLLIYIVKVNDV